jgi:response regulator RpfG family c-di-GMP phosphodiesterase
MLSETSLHTVLMLEYDEDDRFITTDTLHELNNNVQVEFVRYSNEVFAWLENCRENNRSYPAVILLNLHATPSDGKETLKQLKSNPSYQHIPVVLLTEINHTATVKECYALGASSFIKKPSSAKDTSAKIASFFNYWFETVELP